MARAAIVSCAGTSLTAEERKLFCEAQPLGLIIFARNINNTKQLIELTTSFRTSVGRNDAPVLIDQEGGRVARLRPPNWRATEPAETYGALYRRDPSAALEAVKLNATLMAAELVQIGVNVDCVPDADLAIPGAHSVIGNRAYGETPEQVATLGRRVAETMLACGIMPVIKHMPGHGRAQVDSHKELPRVSTDRATLSASDFAAFKLLADLPWGMTGHIVFDAIDPEHPATQSPKIIREIIRGEIGFDGLLLTDDLCMGALQGSMGERTSAALAAGCDIALICDGDIEKSRDGLACAPELGAEALRRYRSAESRRAKTITNVDVAALTARHDALLGRGLAA